MAGRFAAMITVALFAAFIMAAIFNLKESCERSGGKFVRGLFWFECVGRM